MQLPNFKYHPDPVRSGSVEESDARCDCCGQSRGAIYIGPVYAENERTLCPWCIADGSAHRKFETTFVDEESLDDAWPNDAARTIAQRTAGYVTWQSEAWPRRCGAANRLPESLNRKRGPAVYIFQCLHCQTVRFHIDQPSASQPPSPAGSDSSGGCCCWRHAVDASKTFVVAGTYNE